MGVMGQRQVKRGIIGFTGPDTRAMSQQLRMFAVGRRTIPMRHRWRSQRVAVVLVLAMVGTVFDASAGAGAQAADGVPLPVLVKAAKGEACVEPTSVIRRDHMKFLMHQRDDTVHDGIRGARHSLIGCIDCHAAKDDAGQWVRIDAPGQFCASCHAYVSVKIDCFGCHAALPAVAFKEAAK
jgi:hypothetical protein